MEKLDMVVHAYNPELEMETSRWGPPHVVTAPLPSRKQYQTQYTLPRCWGNIANWGLHIRQKQIRQSRMAVGSPEETHCRLPLPREGGLWSRECHRCHRWDIADTMRALV